MAGSLDTVSSSISTALSFVTKNYRKLGTEIAKMYLLVYVLFAAVGAIFVALFLLLGGMAFLSNLHNSSVLSGVGIALIGVIVAGVIAIVIIGFVSESITSVRYVVIDDMQKSITSTPIIKNATRMILHIVSYSILVMVGMIVLMIIPVILLIFGSTVMFPAGLIIAVFGMLLGVFFMILAAFLVQFAILEIAINKAGGLEAIKKSVALVRKNAATVLVYDIALLVISFGIGLVLGVINQIMSFLFIFGFFNIFLLVILALIYFVLILAESVVVTTVISPMTYFFWKSIGGKKGM